MNIEKEAIGSILRRLDILESIDPDSDSAWLTGHTMGTSWADVDAARGIRYRKIGDIIFVRGFVARSATSGATVLTMPTGYIPVGQQYSISQGRHGGSTLFTSLMAVNTSGQIVIATNDPGANIDFININMFYGLTS